LTSESLFVAVTRAVADELSATAWLRAMLQFEVALAEASSELGIIAPESAAAIAHTCGGLERELDPEAIGRRAAEAGTPVEPMLAEVRRRLPDHAAAALHRGATSQDVVDSAAMLVSSRVLPIVIDEVERSMARCADLADHHRRTLMPARTLLQQALPTSFGLKAAGWLTLLGDARSGLEVVAASELVAQFAGAAGTLAASAPHGLELSRRVAARLSLGAPDFPWQANRMRVVRLAAALGASAGAGAKVATDITLMAQTEVGELREAVAPGRGGSSTMPHKRNPIHAVQVRACAFRAYGLAAALAGSLPGEHERAAGLWQAEWQTLTDLLGAAAAAAWHLDQSLDGLEVDERRMFLNLELTGGLLMAERVAMVLSARSGDARAHAGVAAACRQTASDQAPLAETLTRQPEISELLSASELDQALDVTTYLGAGDELIDRALERYRQETE
jgi:3-carboxy-cis,cis-muconate cycloisomerase